MPGIVLDAGGTTVKKRIMSANGIFQARVLEWGAIAVTVFFILSKCEENTKK